jgi:FlaA1/EpsC-like NDP-sugar epimerase
MPSATGKKIERIVSQCRDCKIDFKILPKVSERINGSPLVPRVRQLEMADLLGREPVCVDLERISKDIRGSAVLITGAGGSIGSELARQVASFGPKCIVCFERSENDLFRLSMELSSRFPEVEAAPIVGDILDVNRLREAFALFRPSFVLHAAAYKHVPMMEKNCFQAVTNNIFGTYNVALVARQFRAENFVMISSDKAVRPTNVMGATKRAAELITLALQHEHTSYKVVRFGNVLGSNGSVIPIFQQQIANGGPVTVTHPEATRYFMSIPEAVQLVLQTSVMGRGGEIFVLDMGEPIRILDVARNLIRLSGFEPDVDIRIVFTGMRPGEKLTEELVLDGEGIELTEHRKVRVLHSVPPEFEQVQDWLKELSALVARNNTHALIQKLMQIVPEYQPGEDIRRVCEIDRYDRVLSYSLASLGMSERAA